MTNSTSSLSPIGFDAFFSEITNSKESKDLKNSGTDIASLADLEMSLTDMQSGVEKAANLMKDYDTMLVNTNTTENNDDRHRIVITDTSHQKPLILQKGRFEMQIESITPMIEMLEGYRLSLLTPEK